MFSGPWKAHGLACPAGHTRAFTQYGLGLYSCHDCSPIGNYKFIQRDGITSWIEPDKVPIGLRRMASAAQGQRRRAVSITSESRGRPVTAAEAKKSVQRLINSHFNNDDQARVCIPRRLDDDDIIASDYVEESAAQIAALTAEVARLKELVEWRPITAENLPKDGDEVAGFNEYPWHIGIVSYAVIKDFDCWRERSMTHFRPLSAPAAPQVTHPTP